MDRTILITVKTCKTRSKYHKRQLTLIYQILLNPKSFTFFLLQSYYSYYDEHSSSDASLKAKHMTAHKQTDVSALRVLVVDDDKVIQELYRTYLGRRNCACEVATSGRDALLILMKQTFDVLIVDLKMENMDGMVFVQEALKIWPWLAVVISSGFVTPDTVNEAAKLGISRVISKTETVETLLDHVFEAAAERREHTGMVVEDNALRLMRAHMRMMTRLTRGHAEAEALMPELSQFGCVLSDMLAADMSGILMYRDNERNLLLSGPSPLSKTFASSVTDEMITRFNILSGQSISKHAINIEHSCCCDRDTAASLPGKIVSIPIIMGDAVGGLLTLASTDKTPYSLAETSLLYHAANHVSTLFTTLQEIHSLATHDSMTGLFNRLRMNEELARAWDLSQRHKHATGLMILDLDGIKTINDTYGHASGDEVICDFASIINKAVRGSDLAARLGGDEFVIILPQVTEEGAMALATRILERTREHQFCGSTLKLNLTTSIGIAISTTAPPAESHEALLQRSDQALYAAKRQGRDKICVWDGS